MAAGFRAISAIAPSRVRPASSRQALRQHVVSGARTWSGHHVNRRWPQFQSDLRTRPVRTAGDDDPLDGFRSRGACSRRPPDRAAATPTFRAIRSCTRAAHPRMAIGSRSAISASATSTIFRCLRCVAWGDHLYVGTLNHDGFQLWRSTCEGEPPYRWERILDQRRLARHAEPVRHEPVSVQGRAVHRHAAFRAAASTTPTKSARRASELIRLQRGSVLGSDRRRAARYA